MDPFDFDNPHSSSTPDFWGLPCSPSGGWDLFDRDDLSLPVLSNNNDDAWFNEGSIVMPVAPEPASRVTLHVWQAAPREEEHVEQNVSKCSVWTLYLLWVGGYSSSPPMLPSLVENCQFSMGEWITIACARSRTHCGWRQGAFFPPQVAMPLSRSLSTPMPDVMFSGGVANLLRGSLPL
jgi:hypothetical protein